MELVLNDSILNNYKVRLIPTRLISINFDDYRLAFDKLKKPNMYRDYNLNYLLNKLKNNLNPDHPDIKLGQDGTSLTWKLIGNKLNESLIKLRENESIIDILPDPGYFNLNDLNRAFHHTKKYTFIGWIIQIGLDTQLSKI